jgi:hypothetical protein
MGKLLTVLALSIFIVVIASNLAGANETTTADNTISCKANTSAAQPVVTESKTQK